MTQFSAICEANDSALVEGSADRLTITVRGTRHLAERVFALHIHDYESGRRWFFANDSNPAIAAPLAQNIQGIIGLSNLAVPEEAVASLPRVVAQTYYATR